MPEDTRKPVPPRGGKPGGERRGGGRPDRPGGKGRPHGGKGGFGKGPGKPARAETYESLKEVTRGPDFRIDKFVLAEKQTHKPVKVEYRLIREGLTGPLTYSRLAEAQAAATAPLPEPVVASEEAEIPAAPEPAEHGDASSENTAADEEAPPAPAVSSEAGG